MREDDIVFAMRFKDNEGWNQTETDWRFFMKSDPELCLVACDDGRPVGTVTAINYNNEVAWIGMMLVDKGSRGRGVGKRLLETIVERLDGCHSVRLDATPAGLPVYEKSGFVMERTVHRMTVKQLSDSVSVEYSGEILPVEESNLSEIIDFDKRVFGTDRTVLIQFLAENFPELCRMAKREGKIVGAALGRRGSLYEHFGPVMADSVDDAIALVAQASRAISQRAVLIDVPAEQQDLQAWLEQLGFSRQRPLYRMFLKSNAYPGQVSHQFAIGGPELG